MINVEFNYEQKEKILKCDLNSKLLSIFKYYAKKENLDINHLFFLYSGENLNSNEYLDKNLKEIINLEDINENKIIINVNYTDFDRTSSFISLNSLDEYEEIENNNIKGNFKLFIRLYFLLFIKFIFILIIVGICFFFGFNSIIINNKFYILGILISSILTISIISIFIFFIPEKARYSKKNYIFHFFYIICIISTCLALSKYINSKIIIICIIIININIISIGIFITIFKNYNCYGFLFIPFIINIILLVLLNYIWVKNLYQILYIAGFTLFFTISHFITTYSLFKNFEIRNINEFIYLGIVISLSLFVLIGLLIYQLYNHIKTNILVNYNRAKFFYIYLIIILEFIFIFLIDFLGFYFKFNSIFYDNLTIISISLFLIILFTLLSLILLLKFQDNNTLLFTNFIFLIPCIIISIFLISKYLKENFILKFFVILLSNAFSKEIYILITSKWINFGVLLVSIFFNLLSILFIYLFWEKI